MAEGSSYGGAGVGGGTDPGPLAQGVQDNTQHFSNNDTGSFPQRGAADPLIVQGDTLVRSVQTLPGSTDGNNKDPELSAPQPLPATPFDFKRTEMVIKQAQAHLGGDQPSGDKEMETNLSAILMGLEKWKTDFTLQRDKKVEEDIADKMSTMKLTVKSELLEEITDKWERVSQDLKKVESELRCERKKTEDLQKRIADLEKESTDKTKTIQNKDKLLSEKDLLIHQQKVELQEAQERILKETMDHEELLNERKKLIKLFQKELGIAENEVMKKLQCQQEPRVSLQDAVESVEDAKK